MKLFKFTDRIPMPVGVFLLIRLLLVTALPLDGLRGYGDFAHFYQMAALPGLPYLNYWSEFPPVFPFLSEMLYWVAGGKEHIFTYLLVFLLTAADCGSLLLFLRIQRLVSPTGGEGRTWVYAAFLASLPYGWWYFDSLAVFFLMLGLSLVLENRSGWKVGAVLGLGALTKLFPLLALPAVVHRKSGYKGVITVLSAFLVTVGVYGILYAASPEMTHASLVSQSSKGSWETIWALIDGNFQTGNFGGEWERLDPSTAQMLRGNPAVISPWVILAALGLIGIYFWLKYNPATPKSRLIFTGLTATLFFLATSGWSPQWVLYLLPLILLTFPEGEAQIIAVLWVLINLCEWPLLLSRGLWWGLWLTIPLRTILLLLCTWSWIQALRYPPERATL